MNSATGRRCDVHYSFYGSSIRKTRDELIADGVTLCMCKCPNADNVIDSPWHRRHGKLRGIGWKWVYENRRDFWPCDVFVPTIADFMAGFELLGGRVPTTGFAAILDVLSFEPSAVYLTGFDFFTSGRHDISRRWRRQNGGDPIGHVPEREMEWVQRNLNRYPISVDRALAKLIGPKRMWNMPAP